MHVTESFGQASSLFGAGFGHAYSAPAAAHPVAPLPRRAIRPGQRGVCRGARQRIRVSRSLQASRAVTLPSAVQINDVARRVSRLTIHVPTDRAVPVDTKPAAGRSPIRSLKMSPPAEPNAPRGPAA